MGKFFPPAATTAERAALTLDAGELVYDETLDTLYIGDGVTLGGVTLQGPQGPSVADGDKGDITVSGSSAVWTVDNSAITLAKMANLAQDAFIIRTTASTGVPQTATCTAAGRALIDDADAAAQRVTLGLEIGVNVQAYDADLTTLAGLGAGARTALGLAIGTDVQAYDADLTTLAGLGAGARTALGLAIGTDVQAYDADLTTLGALGAGARTALGLAIGTDVQAYDSTTTKNAGTQTLTNKRITLRRSNEASSATPTINTDNVDLHDITALATAMTSLTTNLTGTPVTGDPLIVRIKDNGTARALTFGASFESSGNVTLPTTTVISTLLTLGFLWDGGVWRLVGKS